MTDTKSDVTFIKIYEKYSHFANRLCMSRPLTKYARSFSIALVKPDIRHYVIHRAVLKIFSEIFCRNQANMSEEIHELLSYTYANNLASESMSLQLIFDYLSARNSNTTRDQAYEHMVS